MGEQTATTVQPKQTSACPHPEAVGIRWGDPISEERQKELQGCLDRWNAGIDQGERTGPFDGVPLTGAEVSWLAEQSEHEEFGSVPNLNLQGAKLIEAHLETANLRGAKLKGAFLGLAYLEGANLIEAHLEGASLIAAHLKGADLGSAHMEDVGLAEAHLEGAKLQLTHLERASLVAAHLERADLLEAHLEGANLSSTHLEGAIFHRAQMKGTYFDWAHMEGADLSSANLEGSVLNSAHLEGADLSWANLKGADLIRASFDKTSLFNNATLIEASFDQVIFDNTNLTVVDWSLVTTLGDQRTAQARTDWNGKPKTRETRLADYKSAVRANRVLSVSLQAVGLAEDGDRFAYQAQVLQRQVLRYQRNIGGYLFSLLLAGLAGYGYRLRRIFIVYGLAVLFFAAGYFLAGGVTPQAHLSLQQQALDALQVSLNAIHGRVFFTQLGLDTLQSWLATIESIVGIVIEGVFVAMLIQRFFAR